MGEVDTSCLYSGNAGFIEDLYERYLENPEQVGSDWREYFSRLQREQPSLPADTPHSPVRRAFYRAVPNGYRAAANAPAGVLQNYQKQVSVLQLINAYPAISLEAVLMASVASLISPTISLSFSTVALESSFSCPKVP